MAEAGSSSVGEEFPGESERAMSDFEPPQKKPKCEDSDKEGQGALEDRLHSILCCTVCLDLPRGAMFQCANGHLMCAGCQAHLTADCRLRDETPSCPNCRCELDKCVRNLAVEKTLSELPTDCMYCHKKLPRHAVERHQNELCKDRKMTCKYERIGCDWSGPYHKMAEHELDCPHPQKPGLEVMDALALIDARKVAEVNLYKHIFNLLSFEKIQQSNVQIKPYRTDDFIPRLHFESARVNILGQQWVIRARVNDSESQDPTLVSARSLFYSLALKSRPTSPVDVHYMLLKGPHSDLRINPAIYRFEFTTELTDAPYLPLPVEDSTECNRILAQKSLNLRLIMFQVTK